MKNGDTLDVSNLIIKEDCDIEKKLIELKIIKKNTIKIEVNPKFIFYFL